MATFTDFSADASVGGTVASSAPVPSNGLPGPLAKALTRATPLTFAPGTQPSTESSKENSRRSTVSRTVAVAEARAPSRVRTSTLTG